MTRKVIADEEPIAYRDRITQTATPIDGSAFDFGSGLINAEAALS